MFRGTVHMDAVRHEPGLQGGRVSERILGARVGAARDAKSGGGAPQKIFFADGNRRPAPAATVNYGGGFP
jgi:hypothetical protein